jgi:hypothetical protein
MTSKKKSKKKNQSTESQNNGLLGGRLNGIAVALLTTLVTEIVQQVLERLFPANAQSNAAGGHSEEAKSDSPMNAKPIGAQLENKPVATVAGAVNDRVTQIKPGMQDILKTVRAAVEEATPRLNEAIAVLQASSNDPKQAVATLVRDVVTETKENLSTAAPNLDSWINSAMNTTQAVLAGVAAVNSEEPKQKHKKKKGKKNKGKNSKK